MNFYDLIRSKHIAYVPKQTMRIMRLTIVIIIVSLMQVSATSVAQNVSLKEKNASLSQVLSQLRTQTGYDFLYSQQMLKMAASINIDVKDRPLASVLEEIFSKQPLNYTIRNQVVVISKKALPLTQKIINAVNESALIIDVKLKILDESGTPLPNATIKIKDSSTSFFTDANGEIKLQGMSIDAIFQISYVGYKTKEIRAADVKGSITIHLEPIGRNLGEVKIVNTGYQKIAKDRATGSFEILDSTLINRVTGSNFINRLEGLSPALVFYNKDLPQIKRADQHIRIRTESSISTLGPPLIVIDNFQYDGNIDNINPNDIENITILKDAAATAIWGIKASRGVIVITTKKGKFNQPMRIDFNSNVSVGGKPDPYAMRQASPKDYIEVEKFFFDRGAYNTALDPNNVNSPLSVSPAVQLFYQLDRDQIDQATYDQKIAELESHDLRDDFIKYVYRPSINQQYAININGGAEKATYSLAAGYDQNRMNIKGSDYNRFTLRSNTIFKPIDKLEIQAGLSFALGTNNLYSNKNGLENYDYRVFKNYNDDRYPHIYLRLADDSGNPLVYDEYYYRKSWLNGLNSQITNGKLQSWDYNPLAEMGTATNQTISQDILFNLTGRYQIIPGLTAEVAYQYEKITENAANLFTNKSIILRNQINYYSSWPGGILQKGFPEGDYLYKQYGNSNANTLRTQLNYSRNWNNKHEINAVMGAERKELNYDKDATQKYGYNQETLTSKSMNLDSAYKTFNGGRDYIQDKAALDLEGTLARSISLYTTATYTYLSKYSLSGSIRKDASNFLGTRNRWQPQWSTGLAWVINREDFYNFTAIPYLKFRTTYGYNGNVNNYESALALISFGGISSITGLPEAQISSPPNPDLTFEKLATLNFAFDFASANQRISGSIEGFFRKGSNIIAQARVDPATGFTTLSVNSAATRGRGLELTLNTDNLGARQIKWNTTLNFTYGETIVTKFFGPDPVGTTVAGGNVQQYPIPGKDANSVFAYKFAGLDPETGDPLGYLNGEKSDNYTKLLNPTPFHPDSLHYYGSKNPVFIVALRNTFSYKGFSLSANIMGKFRYFFQRQGVYYSAFTANGQSSADFAKRWKEPGDETRTNVPSLAVNALRDQFYMNSEAMIEPADHIRLQDIVLNYQVPVKLKNLNNLRLYANATNVNVIIWRKNKQGIDPDFQNFMPTPRTIAFGVSANF